MHSSYLSKIMTYHEVHKLSREGFSISYISAYLGLNWRTVKKLLSVEDDRNYAKQLQPSSGKAGILAAYEEFVRVRLEKYPETSSAQMHDWLKEHHSGFPTVSAKTVFNFVAFLRRKYHLEKATVYRQCTMVEETPHGQQGQVDFGVYSLRRGDASRVKVYFFVMVLSRSRYKYVHFREKPFTAAGAVESHEEAFGYMEGIPDTVVYDQDRVFLVAENGGDLILTDIFRNYCRRRGFKTHFCRKADPQSKGKVENCVKYVKQNFLYNRPYGDIDQLNSEVLEWLARTANALPHHLTRKAPATEWATEKMFLKPWEALALPTPPPASYAVRKDNSFSYKGNFYSLPLGTYQGRGSCVLVSCRENHLVVTDAGQRELCRHAVCMGRGEKVLNNDHKRDKSQAITELEDRFCATLPEPEKGRLLLLSIRKDKPRYVRDQLLLLLECTEGKEAALVARTLDFCLSAAVKGAADFKAALRYFERRQKADDLSAAINPLDGKAPHQAFVNPATSHIEDYDRF